MVALEIQSRRPVASGTRLHGRLEGFTLHNFAAPGTAPRFMKLAISLSYSPSLETRRS